MTEEDGASSPDDGELSVADHYIDSERLDDISSILNPSKIRLLQQILASPSRALAAVELAARNDLTESTIRDHLRSFELRERPIVTTLEANTGGRVPNGIPRKYYAVTDYGIGLLKQLGLYEQVGILYDVYQSADLELPNTESRPVDIESVESYQYRPSPEWI